MTTHKPSWSLVADVGNTRLKLGLFLNSDQANQLPEPAGTISHQHLEHLDWTPLLHLLEENHVAQLRCLVAGSNPENIQQLMQCWDQQLPAPSWIQSSLELPLRLDIEYPEKLGVDRALNAVAANHLRQHEQPAIVVDSGTATTIDVVANDGTFLGGAILPGYELSTHALHDYTAKLPFIPMADIIRGPHPVLGKETHAALRSGLVWGQVGAVNEIVNRIQQEVGASLLLLTGGAATLLKGHLKGDYQHYPLLTLQGLASVNLSDGQ